MGRRSSTRPKKSVKNGKPNKKKMGKLSWALWVVENVKNPARGREGRSTIESTSKMTLLMKALKMGVNVAPWKTN